MNEFVPNKCKKEKKSNQIKLTCLETYHVRNVLMKRHMLVKKAKDTGTTLQKISLKKNNKSVNQAGYKTVVMLLS